MVHCNIQVRTSLHLSGISWQWNARSAHLFWRQLLHTFVSYIGFRSNVLCSYRVLEKCNYPEYFIVALGFTHPRNFLDYADNQTPLLLRFWRRMLHTLIPYFRYFFFLFISLYSQFVHLDIRMNLLAVLLSCGWLPQRGTILAFARLYPLWGLLGVSFLAFFPYLKCWSFQLLAGLGVFLFLPYIFQRSCWLLPWPLEFPGPFVCPHF